MQNMLFKSLGKKLSKKESSELFELKANRVFLEGPAGSGKTYFINRTVEKILEDKDLKTNFVLANAHGDFSELANKLLELEYKIYIISSNTDGRFVKIDKDTSELNVATCNINDQSIWNSITRKNKIAVIINAFNIDDTELYKSTVNNCIKELLENEPVETVDLVTVIDDLEFLFDFNKDTNKGQVSPLITELFKKYSNPYVECLKIVLSGQRISDIPVISELLNTMPIYQYVNFDTGFSSSGSKTYTASNKLKNNVYAKKVNSAEKKN